MYESELRVIFNKVLLEPLELVDLAGLPDLTVLLELLVLLANVALMVSAALLAAQDSPALKARLAFQALLVYLEPLVPPATTVSLALPELKDPEVKPALLA